MTEKKYSKTLLVKKDAMNKHVSSNLFYTITIKLMAVCTNKVYLYFLEICTAFVENYAFHKIGIITPYRGKSI